MMEKTILFINRDSTFLDDTSAVLTLEGYVVRTAVDMRGALYVLSNDPVGLIICDQELQDVSGLDLLNFIKKDPLREAIPFMFLVSADNQGGAFKAFQLGAADYLVYPLDPKVLVGRVAHILSGSGAAEPPPGSAAAAEPSGQDPAGEENPDELRSIPGISVEVSRDGVIWLPGKIQSFGSMRLFVETSLFGKAGVSLMARLRLAEGIFVSNGYIKDIHFEDFQKPAIIEMHTQQEDGWRRIHAYLAEIAQTAPAGDADASDPQALDKTVVLTPDMSEKTAYRTGPFQPSPQRKPGYDLRFYHSIIGKQLDNYRAITLIGAGSMGGVIQGWDVALEREVALKVISYELSSKETFREMFIKEARVVSRLNHLNIAQIYYIGTSNDILYYAMEFVDGLTLKDLVARQGNLPILKGMEYLITVCEALDYVHRNGIVHRDMKPANIMISNGGQIKIVDFGVAVSGDAGRKTGRHRIIGSPLYMSPEQVAGLALDYRSDIYSVGATFYHVFTGSPPFEDDDVKVIMAQHIDKPLPPMRDKNPHIPTALSKTIEKMMAKDPLDRHKDFQSVADELKALFAHILRRKRNR